MKIIRIKKNDENIRLDNFLIKCFPTIKKNNLYKFFRKKKIKVNGKKVNFKYLTKNGDVVQLFADFGLVYKKNTFSLKKEFNVIYEDKNVLIVDKPKGLVVHSDFFESENSLIKQVISYLIAKKEYDPENENIFVPSLVNRIDRNTGGLVIIAKNHETLQILNEKIKNHEIQKEYICKVHGIVDPKRKIVTSYLTKNQKHNIVKITNKPINLNSKKIITSYEVISHDSVSSILKVNLVTGRTHQIRAHLNFLGYPLYGEHKYTQKEYKDKLKFQSLCAYSIAFKFKNNSGILSYLRGKTIKLSTKDIYKYL